MAMLHSISFRRFVVGAADRAGFTLIELMIVVGLFSLVMAGSLGVYIMCQRLWRATSLSMDTSRMASLAIQRMVYGVDDNSGLRGASMITLINCHGYPYPYTSKYWETNGSPPKASDTMHYVCSDTAYPKDGWRMTVSNAFDGVKYIEYNAQVRNILFCPDTNLQGNVRLTTAARSQRILIGNYIASATVTTNDGTVEIQLTVWKKDGMFVASNQVSAFVRMRN